MSDIRTAVSKVKGVATVSGTNTPSVAPDALHAVALGAGGAKQTNFLGLSRKIADELTAWAASDANTDHAYKPLINLFETFLVGGKKAKIRLFQGDVPTCSVQVGTKTVVIHNGKISDLIDPDTYTFTRFCACLNYWRITSWPQQASPVSTAMSTIFSIDVNADAAAVAELELVKMYLSPGCHFLFNAAAADPSENHRIGLAVFLLDAKTINDGLISDGDDAHLGFNRNILEEIRDMPGGGRLALARYGGQAAATMLTSPAFVDYFRRMSQDIVLVKSGASMRAVREATNALAAAI
jgi:hypothetical protein